jgi:hypothetical protein
VTSENEDLVGFGSSNRNMLRPCGRQLVTTELLLVPIDLVYKN